MKVAIVADVHGNLPALEAVVADLGVERPHLVVHGGDLVLNGPRPAEVLDLVRELGWPGVLGNTDEVLWQIPERLPERLRAFFVRAAEATRGMLGEDRLAWLRRLPPEWRSQDLLLVHAAPGDVWGFVDAGAPDQELAATFGGQGAGMVVYCHIHKALVRELPGLTVANTGSVSIPADGDWRASYLIVEDGHPRHRRVEYDLERAIADLRASGYPAGEELAEMQRTGGFTPRRLL
ncbi:MAG: metallophosphoesterase family protein [Candidatus Dormibacteraceae bacterium]